MPDSFPPPAPRRHWLSFERLHLYALPLLAASLCLIGGALSVDLQGRRIAWLPVGDFIAYWSAAHLALDGQALSAYQLPRLAGVEQAALPGFAYAVSWHYPPTFLLLLLPLALLPLSAAWLLFMFFSLACYLAVLSHSLDQPRRLPTLLLLLCAFPGTALNIMFGQNAFLTAALMGGGLLLLQRRPWLAGLCFGLLTLKPQLGLLLPLALLCGGHWRAIAAAAGSATLLLLVSVMVFGADSLPAFWQTMAQARHWLEAAGPSAVGHAAEAVQPGGIDAQWLAQGRLDRRQIPTLFAFARELGAPLLLAYGLQLAQALLAALVVARAWRVPLAPLRRQALLVLGSLLATPYLFDYELAWLLLPIAAWAAQGLREGWRRGEREWLVAAYALPLPLLLLSLYSGLPWLQFLFLALFLRLAWYEKALLLNKDAT